MNQPGSPTAFEDLVDDYDAARPHYPQALYDALPPLGAVLELGAGTGIASEPLAGLCTSLVVSDLGPKMLQRGLLKHPWPGVVCAAEALPFADRCFDSVCGAQMWHWTSDPAAEEVARVLRPGGQLLLWWNETRALGADWFEAQQERLEAGNPDYRPRWREVDYNAHLSRWFEVTEPVVLQFDHRLSLDLYARLLRSKSYVQRLPDVDAFVAASIDDLREAFPDGQVVEPFLTRLWTFTVRP